MWGFLLNIRQNIFFSWKYQKDDLLLWLKYNKMEETEKIYLASKCVEKGYNYETLLYGDDLYSYDSDVRNEIAEEIWEYVTEYQDIGRISFRDKYKEGRLY